MNIKKLLAASLLMMMAQLMVAQVSNPFFEKLKSAKGAEVMEIGEELMPMLKALLENPEHKAAMEHVTSQKTLSIDLENTPAALATVRSEAAKLEKAGMTKLYSETESNNEGAGYVHVKDDGITEIFVWFYNKAGFMAIQMNGTFSKADLNNLTKVAK